MKVQPSVAFGVVVHLRFPNRPGRFAAIANAVASLGGDLGDVTILGETRQWMTRSLTINCENLDHEKAVVAALRKLPDIEVLTVEDRTFRYHLGGKMEIRGFRPLDNVADLSIAYTPGVGRICMAIHDDKRQADNLTIKGNTVAVVTDGTAVLGLGDIGPEAAMPVMEGKCLLFKTFANVDAIPICIDTKEPDEIVKFVRLLAPTLGGVNLEDISAPRCFEIEERLKRELSIPVFHDDQHGTAVVCTAALLNALRLTGRKAQDLKVIVCGTGAAGVACTKMLLNMGVTNIIGTGRKGALHRDDADAMDPTRAWYARNTNPEGLRGSLSDVIEGADLFIGLSAPGILTLEDLKRMNPDPIVFAMSNPIPEIMPEIAGPHVAVMATGRSDYPNQINNVLAFPGIFRGALDVRATAITEGMKLAAAHAIADLIPQAELTAGRIIPSPFDGRVAPAVAEAVAQEAVREGVAAKEILSPPSFDEITR